MIAETKVCLNCRGSLHGRSDKKFCNDYCRNTHHNLANSDSNNYIRNINYCLRKNRRILESLLLPSRQIVKTSRQALHNKGFSFHYRTHTYTNKKGNQFLFCYDYGYRILEKEQVLIVRGREY